MGGANSYNCDPPPSRAMKYIPSSFSEPFRESDMDAARGGAPPSGGGAVSGLLAALGGQAAAAATGGAARATVRGAVAAGEEVTACGDAGDAAAAEGETDRKSVV